MPIRIKVQRDYYVTEVSLELPTEIAEVDELLRATLTNGKLVVQYNQGMVQGVNIEQRHKVSEEKANKIRPMLEIADKVL